MTDTSSNATKDHSGEGPVVDATTITIENDAGSSSPEESPQLRASVSKLASEGSSGRLTAPWWLQWIEVPFRIKEPNTGTILPEATGFAMDSASRGPLNHVGAFLGSTLLVVASIDAGCTNPRTCDQTLGGLKPSSLLSLTSVCVGVAAAMLMPLLGAVVDHTRHRKLVGALSAVVVLIVTASQISINETNWLPILILESIGGFTLIVHITAAFAYLPDLSDNTEVLAHYTSRFNIRQYVFQTLFVTSTVIVAVIMNRGGSSGTLQSSIEYTRISLGICFAMTFTFLSYAWTFLFRKRPPLSQVPEGSTLLTAGFVQIGKTGRKVWNDYRSLKWFMISLLTSPEAGTGTMIAILVTFLTIFVGLSPMEISYASLLLIVCNVCPGSFVAKYLCVKINPLNSYRVGLVVFGASFGMAAAVLSGPSRKNWTYLFAAMWGVCMGWVYPSQRVLFCTLIPKGQETEMMGLFVFSGQIIGWLPVLLFTTLNENGVDMRLGLSLLTFFSFFSVICTLPMGSYTTAMKEVSRDVDGTSHGLSPQAEEVLKEDTV